MNIYTVDEMRRIEEYEDTYGTSFLRLMENAGSACARQIVRFIKEKYMDEVSPQRVVRVCVVCGKGKNGGDGFVIARKLAEKGYQVKIVLVNGFPVARDAAEMYKKAETLGVVVNRYDKEPALCTGIMQAADIVVDCIFGIGFHGKLESQTEEIIRRMNEGSGFRIAVDVPSAVNADTGEVAIACVNADVTLAISALKPAHVLLPSKKYCGSVEVLDIGISSEAMASVPPSLSTFEKHELEAWLPFRADSSHKNDFGHVLVVAGSMNMPGAACLCANAALVTGAGLVTVAFPNSAYPSLAAHTLEAMLCPLPETYDGFISEESLPILREKLEKATVLVIGPGLGRGPNVQKVVEDLIKSAKCPIVLDADGLNAIVDRTELFKEAHAPIVITPHPGEMSRIAAIPKTMIEENRIKVAKEFADSCGVTVLLKGPATVVASPDREKRYINQTGNAGLAKGGSGDVLTGVIAAFLAQGLEPFEAAGLGAYVHGYAGDLAAELHSRNAMVASDLFEGIKEIYKKYDR